MATVAINAQQAITILGGGASNSNGSISNSAGEVAVRRSVAKAITVVNITEYFTEGVQQTYSIKRENIASPLPVNINVGPNPTSDCVDIFVSDASFSGSLNFSLFDIKGELIKSGRLDTEKTHIDMSALPTGIYMLDISNDNKEKNVYKIIKAN